ncbi:MAG: hypothetical protein ACK6C0_08720 [Betaproteobacteria bacterium]|jgi:hypothetical protein
MSTLALTQVYLEPRQKKALQSRARAHGTRVSEEIRSAVDAYLAGITADELQLLDTASRAAAADLEAMRATLAATNRKLDDLLARIERERTRAA